MLVFCFSFSINRKALCTVIIAFREVLREPFIINQTILNGMYPLQGVKHVYDALKSWPVMKVDQQKILLKPLDSMYGMTNSDSLDDTSFCEGEGSLHQIGLDMFNAYSPPGSPSYKKLKHILDTFSQFYLDTPRGFFVETQNSIERMLKGYGLEVVINKGDINRNVILIDTYARVNKSPCSIYMPKCLNRPRLYIQSEQVRECYCQILHLKEGLSFSYNSLMYT